MRRGRQAVGDACQILDGSVVKVSRNATAFELGRLDGTTKQSLSPGLVVAEESRATPGEWELNQPQQCECAENRGCKRKPELPAARRYRAIPLVRLEHQRSPVRSANSEIDLEQLVERAFETIFRTSQIADLGLGAATRKRLQLVGTKGVTRADQSVLVGVGDRPVRTPDLHPDDVPLQDAAMHGAIDTRDRPWVASHEIGCEQRLYYTAPGELCDLCRVANRLVLADVPQEVDPGSSEQDQHGNSAQSVLGHSAANVM